jgi:DNA mismatch endonuclease, patch repair protein
VTHVAETEHPIPSSSGVSGRMSRQRRRDTAPEVLIRKLLHAWGLRFRVTLPVPGMARRSIDIAFPKARVAVFVDGCFWHVCPEHRTSPTANSEWWATKLAKNQARDIATNEHLDELGWTVIRIWEHESPLAAAEKIRGAVRARRESARPVG